MANRDQRGPEGRGPMTGRGLGRCNGKGNTENRADVAPARGGRGRGLGNRRGLGRGQGRRFEGAPSQDDQSSLVAEVRALRDELVALKTTINNPGEDQ